MGWWNDFGTAGWVSWYIDQDNKFHWIGWRRRCNH